MPNDILRSSIHQLVHTPSRYAFGNRPSHTGNSISRSCNAKPQRPQGSAGQAQAQHVPAIADATALHYDDRRLDIAALAPPSLHDWSAQTDGRCAARQRRRDAPISRRFLAHHSTHDCRESAEFDGHASRFHAGHFSEERRHATATSGLQQQPGHRVSFFSCAAVE